ncbi:MAG: M48 family metalloprotease [Pirellulaceae bacterium]
MNQPDPVLPPSIPDYLFSVRELLKTQMPDIWQWFCSDEFKAKQREAIELDLLKSTTAIDETTRPDLYAAARKACAALDVKVPLAFYKAQQTGTLNASISMDVAHTHIVIEGEPERLLDEDELVALMGHELGHILLWEDSDLLVANRMLQALAQVEQASPVHLKTQRRFRQFTEVFCDRCAAVANGRPTVAVAALAKMEMEVQQIDIERFIQQAHAAWTDSAGHEASNESDSHPELSARARALDLWRQQTEGYPSDIETMICGPISLADPDLRDQQTLRDLTRHLIDHVLQPDWMQSESGLSHARMFFDDYETRPGKIGETQAVMRRSSDEVQDYAVFLMLDFVTADRGLLEPALARTISLAAELGLKSRYLEIARKELRMRKKQLEEIENMAAELVARAEKISRIPPETDSVDPAEDIND